VFKDNSGLVVDITSEVLRSSPWPDYLLRNICVTNDHGYVPLVVITIQSFFISNFSPGLPQE